MPGLDLSWHQHAACRGRDLNLFFPDGHAGAWKAVIAEAKAVCAGCPVREQCGEFAYRSPEKYGIWNGETEEERAAGRRAWLRRTVNERQEGAA